MQLKKIVLIAFLFITSAYSKAQQATTTGGGSATGSGGTVAYSIGQPNYTTNSSSTGKVTQGVQQTYTVSVVAPNEINESTSTVSMSIYPNPTTDNLTLQVSDFSTEKLKYEIIDIQGKLIESKEITANQTQLNMSSLPTATYFINIKQENKTVQQFKIIKN